MFKLALIIGLYGYLIFLLGILGLLYKEVIITFSITYLFTVFFLYLKTSNTTFNIKKYKFSRLSKIFMFLISLQVLVNLIGALGPELSFDALWYHLTIPKVFLENHRIFHISGNLLYYSDLPKNIDLIYLSFLGFSNEIVVKLIHLGFGILSVFALYQLSKKFLNKEMSLAVCLIFYSNLVIGWQSITAYVDLGVTFFEIVSLYYFFKWLEKYNFKFLLFSSITLGFSLSAKISVFNSIAVFIFLLSLIFISKRINFSKYLKSFSIYLLIPLLITLPWLVFSFINTGNPIYPLLQTNFNILHDWNVINILSLFIFASDPINPIYLIILPLIILLFNKFDYKAKVLAFYSLLSLLVWFITSSTGGSRFILPFLPAYSILVLITLSKIKYVNLKKYLILLIIVISISSIGYRFLANYKYIPVIIGAESKSEFLSRNLNFSFGDFYDTDGYFKTNIKSLDKVLLYGFHNLYYVDFPYIDSSWVKAGDTFNYVLVQNAQIPKKFSDWKQIYYNNKTMVKLYSKEGKKWVY
jgi:hypothetical protein